MDIVDVKWDVYNATHISHDCITVSGLCLYNYHSIIKSPDCNITQQGAILDKSSRFTIAREFIL